MQGKQQHHGEGAKAGVDEVDKWFKGISDGIEDLGKKL
jgi:hypothetical protein